MSKNSGGTRYAHPGSVGAKVKDGVLIPVHPRWNKIYKQIEKVLDDISENGHLTQKRRFGIGADLDIRNYAIQNGVLFATTSDFMDSKHIYHAQREFHRRKGIYVGDEALKNFPKNRHNMEVFFDKVDKRFIYTDRVSKYVISPNEPHKQFKDTGNSSYFITGYKLDSTDSYNALVTNRSRYDRIR